MTVGLAAGNILSNMMFCNIIVGADLFNRTGHEHIDGEAALHTVFVRD
jgi:hypothetical protein